MNMSFDCNYQPYSSNRYPVIAGRGMVSTSSALASSAGLEILKAGGNAVDAAIAAAAALTVVEPTSNGIGGDAFAIVWLRDKLYGINGSGRAPMGISIEKVIESGEAKDGKMPDYGWTPVTVPGVPGTWAALSKKFGRLPLSRVLSPAVEYARYGYPVSPVVSTLWQRAVSKYSALPKKGDEYEEWFKTFAPEGRGPAPGETVTLKNHADTLELIGKTEAESFYRGELAERMIADSIAHRGYLRKQDLENFHADWVEPLKVNYRGYEVCEIPPNGQGIVALMALNILKEFEFSGRDSVETCHKQMEAIKMAFADGKRYVTDPAFMKMKPEDLINPRYGADRSREIGKTAKEPLVSSPYGSGTIYLCTADGEGNMVSMIQSNYKGFGSGIVVKGTGISLQNRGRDFSLDPSQENALMPGKRTYHTIIPGFLMKDGKAVGPFGMMGGFMQPQGHVQIVMNLIDFHLNPQMALDAPRWQWTEGKKFIVEPEFPVELARQLRNLGHEVEFAVENYTFGRGQIILRMDNGALIGGTESRADSSIACY